MPLDFVSRQSLVTFTNLFLLRRDRLIQEFSPQVPVEEVLALRFAELPVTGFVFPPDLATSATDKKRAASQDALIMQTLTEKRIPRVPSRSRVSKGQVAGTSGQPSGAGVSPVVPRTDKGSSSFATTSAGPARKKKQKRGSGGSSFRGAQGMLVVRAKGSGRRCGRQ